MAEWDYEIFWKETLNQIKNDISELDWALFKFVDYVSANESTIFLAVTSKYIEDKIKKQYQRYIEDKLKELVGKNISILVEIRSKEQQEVTYDTHSSSSEKNHQITEKRASSEKPNVTEKPAHPQLRKDYIFDSYVIGENNTLASNAALAISRNPGTQYNPFLIYGGVGLGKTHLMQSIGNYVYNNNSNMKVIYITAESFTNEFIQAIRDNQTAAFKNKYRFVDILLIDDIHFLQKKMETQEELFHTFNALYDANKQIVFTCDRPVSELKNLSERLRSRFERGLNVDLQPPDYETRFAISKKKIEASGIYIPDDVIALVSKNVSTNIRDLEAALTKLKAYADLIGNPITVETARQQLKDVFASPRQKNISLEFIQKIVAEHYSLSPNDLKSKKRSQNIVFPRQLSMFIAREMTEYSTTEVGQAFGGRDHTTVMHSYQKIEDKIRLDPTLDSTIKTLIRKIEENHAQL
jgi:chromosomal replication initiator protein